MRRAYLYDSLKTQELTEEWCHYHQLLKKSNFCSHCRSLTSYNKLKKQY